jgi:peptidoglycan-N-acetylglucosamine deacetylase
VTGHLAITIDDPQVAGGPLLDPGERMARLLETLRLHHLRSMLFVCGKRVDNEAGARLLDAWSGDGHLLGNHSYSHLNLNDHRVDVAAYQADIVAGEKVIAGRSAFRRVFRYPMLKEGASAGTRDRVRAFLAARGYEVGHVTIDTADWYLDQRLRERLRKNRTADLEAYRRHYLGHLGERVHFYASLAEELLGGAIPHVLLLHQNLLNALFLGDALRKFASEGWTLIDAEEAFAHPVYRRRPATLPAGESLVWALAKESGRFDRRLRYPAEDAQYERPALDRLGL